VVFGTIDADYRGEVLVSMYTFGSRAAYTVHNGDRIAQLVISKLATVDVQAVAELSPTRREAGGHGSTGRQ
jgi:dUTP pyrophosphatase